MKRAGLLLALLAVVVAACEVAPPASKPAPKSSPLAKADTKFFSGDYDGAEKDYQSLIDGGTPNARAHYVLLLDYENRFVEAVQQAQQAVKDNSDSVSLSRLTRALDWSEDVTGAVTAGAKSIKATPVDPLAHLFYGEALADAGRFAEARDQLRAGQKAAADAYTRAEGDRDWANYYRARGDSLQELNHLELSLKSQPDFPERSLELSRYQSGHANAGKAIQLLRDVAKKAATQYGVLTAEGDAAFLQGNAPVAIELYNSALKVRPNGATATLGLSEVDVAVSRDFNTAHDRLLTALKADPKAGNVYQFLRFLDSLVLKKDPTQELAFAQPPPTDGITAARKDALAAVNATRATVGVGAVAENPALAESALAHGYFFLFNFGQSSLNGDGVHFEDPSLPGSFGHNSSDRAAHFGYAQSSITSEVISHVFIAPAAVERWVDTVYHRYPITAREAKLAGYGEAQVGGLSIQVLDFGIAGAQPGELIAYPPANSTGVPAAFRGGEVPDPVPTANYPIGYPITLQAPLDATLAVGKADLTGPAGNAVDAYQIPPGTNNLAPNEFAMLAKSPLATGKYSVTVTGTVNGAAFAKSWQFSV